MALPDKRNTKLLFGLGNSRKELNFGGGSHDGSDEIDEVDALTSRANRLGNESDTASHQSTPDSASRYSTQISTRHGSIDASRLHIPRIEDPWNSLKPLLKVRQGCPAILACSTLPEGPFYAVRSIPSRDRDEHLHAIQKLGIDSGSGFDPVSKMFDWLGELFVVTEYVKTTLSQVITGIDRPTEAHIAFIAHTVLASLVLLEDQGLVHGSLKASFVLIPSSGMPILAHPPCWHSNLSSKSLIDTAALANLMVRLIDKSAITGSKEELRVKKSPYSPALSDFIDCARRMPASRLREHPFLKSRCEPQDIRELKGVVDLTTWHYWESLGP